MIRSPWIVVVLFVSLVIAGVTYGQSATEVRVDDVEVIETADGEPLTLGVYFSIVDGESKRVLLSNIDLESARFTLNGRTYLDESPTQPTTPIFTTLLINIGAAMRTVPIATLQDNLNQVLDSTDEQLSFAVAAFNRQSPPVINFVSSAEAQSLVSNLRYTTENDSLADSCVYDALFQTLAELRRSSGQRRAIVVLTNTDDISSSSGLCSSTTREAVWQEADEQNIPIHFVVLTNTGVPANLQQIAQQTHGMAVSGSVDLLQGLLEPIFESLKAQWFARFQVFAVEGTQTGDFEVVLQSGLPMASVQVTFSADQSYSAPQGAVEIVVSGVAIDYTTQPSAADIRLEITNSPAVGTLEFDLIQDGVLLSTHTASPQPLTHFELPPLMNGERYGLVVTARDTDGSMLFRTDATEFTYQARQADIAISAVEADYSAEKIRVDLQYAANAANSYQVWLFDEDNTRIRDFDFQGTLASPIELDSTNLRAGKYKLELAVLDAAGDRIHEEPIQWEFNYRPPAAPWYSFLATVRQQGLAVAFIGGILVSLVWLLRRALNPSPARVMPTLYNPRSRVDTGTRGSRQSNISNNNANLREQLRSQPAGVMAKPASPHAAAFIILEHVPSSMSDQLKKSIPIHRVPFIIGRKENLGLSLTRAPNYISREHIKINYDSDKQHYTIEDLNSKTGTLFNGVRIAPGESVILTDGTEIQLNASEKAAPDEMIKVRFAMS